VGGGKNSKPRAQLATALVDLSCVQNEANFLLMLLNRLRRLREIPASVTETSLCRSCITRRFPVMCGTVAPRRGARYHKGKKEHRPKWKRSGEEFGADEKPIS
jgi:hypothetical protein